MEITKIFSNVEDPEENLYSVLMSEEELTLFSDRKPLRKTRTGIGWIQENIGKNESEEIFKKLNKKIEEDYKKGESDEDIIKNSKNKAKNIILKKDLPKITGNALLSGGIASGLTYGALKNERFIKDVASRYIDNPNVIDRVIPKKNKGKIALGVGALVGGRELLKKNNLPKTLKRKKSAENGGERLAKAKLGIQN